MVRSSSSIVKSVQSFPDKVQGEQRRQCNTGVQWIRGLLRTSPLLQFPSQRRHLSKILSPEFTVQADETFKPRLQWSEMFRSYIERNQGGLCIMCNMLCVMCHLTPVTCLALPTFYAMLVKIVSMLKFLEAAKPDL